MTEEKQLREASDEFVERTVQTNPLVIKHYWKKGNRPLCYFKRWRHLTLRFQSYDFVRSYRSLEADLGGEFADMIDEIKPDGETEEETAKVRKRREFRHLARRAGEDWDSLSEKEQNRFRWAHLDDVQPAKQWSTIGLAGWADIEWARSITVFSVSSPDKEDELNYGRSFSRIKVAIHGMGEDQVGTLMHWTEDLRQYDGDDDPDGDYLSVDLRMKAETLAALEMEVGRRGGNVPLEIDAQAHLFQYEVEESLAEPYHHQRFHMVYDKSCSMIVNNIRVGTCPPLKDDNDGEELGNIWDTDTQEKTDPESEFRAHILRIADNTLKIADEEFSQIKIALWVLVLLFIVSLFV